MNKFFLALSATTALVASSANATTTIDSAITASGTKTFSFTTAGGVGSIGVEGFCGSATGICDPSIYVFENDLAGAFVAYNDDSGSLNSFLSVNFNPGTYIASIGRFSFQESEARSGIADFIPRQTDFRVTFSDGLSVNGQGAVPEPAAWALMLVGFGAVGSALRRRGNTVRVTYA